MTTEPANDDVASRIERVRAGRSSVPPEKLIRNLLRLFDLKPGEEEHTFTFPPLPRVTRDRLFGGQVIAQAMVAAARTVPAPKQIHSLHAYFLRAGDEGLPTDFTVRLDFDGRSLSNRRVIVRQQDKVIFNLTASFMAPAEGLSHQIAMPDVLGPEEVWSAEELVANIPDLPERAIENLARPRPFEMRGVRPRPQERATRHYQWMRAVAPMPDDPLMHRAALGFASDMGLLSTCMLPHGLDWATPGLFSTSLDHAMWFHADFRADEWLLYMMDTDWSGGSRGLNRGSIYRRDGTLVASAVQEGLLRFAP